MKRRDFIKRTSLASGLFLVPGFLRPLEKISMSGTPKKLVVIQLSGGNDWLNTIVPFKNDLYYKLRPKIALKNSDLVELEKGLALNKALESLKQVYDSGEMAVINNVGYPNPDRSHFRSMDIWHSASASYEYLNTGWLGRFMDNECVNAYEGLEAGPQLSLALKGKKLNGIAVNNLKLLHKEITTPFLTELVSESRKLQLGEDNQGHLYKTLLQTSSAADYFFEKNKIISNNKEYPNNLFSKQLKNIASLIGSDSATRVYFLSLNGFDTHSNQTARHNRLLKIYADGLSTFISNLKELEKWDNTLVLTFSEFGRRAEENASMGTDHGAAGNVLLFGKNLKKKGIVNELPNLENLEDGDLKFSVDFRSVYKNILQNWLQTDAEKIIPSRVNNFEVV